MKTFKYRIFPTKKQKRELDFQFLESKLVYNSLWSIRKQAYEKDKTTVSRYDCQKLIVQWKNNERPQLEKIHSQVLQEICHRLDLAFRSFFRRVKNHETAGYPRFKRDSFCSLSYPQSGYGFKNGKLYIAKIGEVKIKLHRAFFEKPKCLIVKKSTTGKYYVCFIVDEKYEKLVPNKNIVAFDLGIKSFLVTSENEFIDNPKYLEKKLKKLRNYSKQYSKTKSLKHRWKLNMLFEKVKNQREDFQHKLSNRIVKENGVIIHEDLNIKKMLENNDSRVLNRNITDVSWNSFTSKLFYKAENAGRKIVRVNPANTSNTCSKCGHSEKENRKTQSEFLCLHCGFSENADYNASLNIKSLGMQALALA